MEDAPLIARVVADDDRHAFATLVRKHQAAVRAFLVRLCCGDRALADDVAQETFLRAYQRITAFRSEGGFQSWLFSIAYRSFLSEKRKRHWSEEALQDLPESAGPDAALADGAAEDVARAMRHLREPERACITLCYQAGMSHPEIANALGYPVGTVKTHILRGRDKLRSQLSPYAPSRGEAR